MMWVFVFLAYLFLSLCVTDLGEAAYIRRYGKNYTPGEWLLMFALWPVALMVAGRRRV